MGRAVTPPLVRFMRKVEPVGDCLVWTGTTGGSKGPRRGYFRPGTRSSDPKVLAYRWLYEQVVGPIPVGHELDHRKDLGCVGGICVKPSHLEPVSSDENQRRERREVRGGGTCVSGKHPWVESNVHIFPNGSRCCLACRREVDAARHLANKRKVG